MKKTEYQGRLIHSKSKLDIIKQVSEYITANEPELDIQIREDYFNVYYKGGSLCRINSKNSIRFDEMYFYHEPCRSLGGERLPSICVKGNKDNTRNHVIYNSLMDKRREIIRRFKDGDYSYYFTEAKKAMGMYWESTNRSHGEKKDQQDICLHNKKIKDSRYTILDVEFEVSENSDYAYVGSLNKKNPRFDFIAIDNKLGQLVIIELKTGTRSLYNDCGLREHYICFNDTIVRKPAVFLLEMKALLKQKQDLGLLPKELIIKVEEVRFAFAFTCDPRENKKTNGEQIAEFMKEAERVNSDILRIIVDTENYKLNPIPCK